MKLSTFALSTLLAAGLSSAAQTTAVTTTGPVKDSTENHQAKTPKEQIDGKFRQNQVLNASPNPKPKKTKARYCPTCGRG